METLPNVSNNAEQVEKRRKARRHWSQICALQGYLLTLLYLFLSRVNWNYVQSWEIHSSYKMLIMVKMRLQTPQPVCFLVLAHIRSLWSALPLPWTGLPRSRWHDHHFLWATCTPPGRDRIPCKPSSAACIKLFCNCLCLSQPLHWVIGSRNYVLSMCVLSAF